MDPIDLKIIAKQAETEIEQQREDNNRQHDFYKAIYKNGSLEKISFIKSEFLNLLSKYNIVCFDLDIENTKFVQINENLIEEVSIKTIIRLIGKYIRKLPDFEELLITEQEYNSLADEEKKGFYRKRTGKMIYDSYLNNLENLFQKKLLYNALPDRPIEIAEDTKYSKFFFYKNGFVEVTKDKAELKPYEQLQDKYIWKNQMLNRNYTSADNQTGYYEQFIKRVCGYLTPDDKDYIKFSEEAYNERIINFKAIMGYIMHNFTKGKLYAFIFTDSRLSDDGEANGRTGKTLVGKAIGWMLNAQLKSTVYCEINGREFDKRDKHHYSKCNLDTKLIHLNDLYNNFDIEYIYPSITEGTEIKKLYEQSFTIYTKYLLSTNKQIKISGGSAKDRLKIFEFSDYFNENRSPLTEYKVWFFDEWDKKEWDRFDSFMISCVQTYFRNGLKDAEPINLQTKMLQDHTDRDFVSWMALRFLTHDADGEPIQFRIRFNPPETHQLDANKYSKFDFYTEFLIDNPDFKDKKWFDQRKFTRWVKFYIKTMYPDVKINEYRGSGTDFIFFELPPPDEDISPS